MLNLLTCDIVYLCTNFYFMHRLFFFFYSIPLFMYYENGFLPLDKRAIVAQLQGIEKSPYLLEVLINGLHRFTLATSSCGRCSRFYRVMLFWMLLFLFNLW